MSSPSSKSTPGADPSRLQQLTFEKVKLLLARERELNALRQEYQRYQQWLDRVQRITAVLSNLENQQNALKELVYQLVASSSYEFAAAIHQGEFYSYGVPPDADDRAALDELAKQMTEGALLKITVAEPRQICWLMAGPVVCPGDKNDVAFVLFLGRTGRTIGFYPPPWEVEKLLFQRLLPTVAHMFMAVEVRSKLVAERNSLQNKVAQATAQLQATNAQLEEQVAQRTEQLREANERLLKELAERTRADQARAALQEEMIRMQSLRLEELSTPLIPISEQTVVLPLIGTMDTRRAQQVLETALDGAQRHRAQVVIIDITGLKHIDTQVASTLTKVASALRLLGTQTIMTGIRPDVARTLVGLGVDLNNLMFLSTLQSGIAYAMNRPDK